MFVILLELDKSEVNWIVNRFDHKFDQIAMKYFVLSFTVVEKIRKRNEKEDKTQKCEIVKRWMQKNLNNTLKVCETNNRDTSFLTGPTPEK